MVKELGAGPGFFGSSSPRAFATSAQSASGRRTSWRLLGAACLAGGLMGRRASHRETPGARLETVHGGPDQPTGDGLPPSWYAFGPKEACDANHSSVLQRS